MNQVTAISGSRVGRAPSPAADPRSACRCVDEAVRRGPGVANKVPVIAIIRVKQIGPDRNSHSPEWSKRSSAMKKQMFEELLGSVREAGAIRRGQKTPPRRIVIGASGVRAIRERTSLSQSEFAHLIGVSVKTLQNWEQDRRRPTGPVAALLRIISHEPRLAVKAIHRA